MADELIDDAQVLAWLKGCVERAGGTGKLAKRAGVSKALVSQMLGGKPITGKVAEHVGLKRVYRYELNRVVPGTLQEQYGKQRAAWVEQNPIIEAEELNRRLEEQARLREEAERTSEGS
jgi:hypothetical protein